MARRDLHIFDPSAATQRQSAVGAVCDRLDAINATVADLSAAVRSMTPAPPASDVAVHHIQGLRLLLDSTSLVDRLVIEQGEWEGDQVKYLTRLAERFRHTGKAYFLDLGSYWGYYSFMMWKTGIFEQVHAYDADAYNFSQLQANIFLNKLDGVIHARHAAVSDAAGRVTMQSSRGHLDGNRGATRVVGEHEVTDEVQTRVVPSVAIDDVLAFSGAHLVIKMDVEAHEPQALRGMRRTITQNQVFLQIEIYKEQTAAVLPILEELGLRRIAAMYPDFFYTNIPEQELGF